MKKIAEFVVKFRYLFLMLFIAFGCYCGYGMTKTKIEYDISTYLPKETDTAKALDIMDKEFYTFGSTTIMLKNVSFEEAQQAHDEIEKIDGVKKFDFYNTADYYKDSNALFNIVYDGKAEDEVTINAYEKTKEVLSGYEYYIKNDLNDNYSETLQKSINFVLLITIGIIVVVLLFTSESVAEVPVFLATFGMAALMNMGTNYWLGSISFVSNSVCSILQLALAIDYAIILANRFQEEKKMCLGHPKEAMINALSKAIPEIAGSSLTTIAGMLALCTMSFKLGTDLGLSLVKSILFSMVAVFLFMPALLLIFDKPIEKTMHKSLVPKISFVGKFDVKTRFVTPLLFLAIASGACYYSLKTDYCFGLKSIDSHHPSAAQVAISEISETFGYTTQCAIVLPGNDYEMQYDVLNMVEKEPLVKNAQGIANTEISRNDLTYRLPEKMDYRQFADFLGTDYQTADTIYGVYAYLSAEDSQRAVEEVAIYNIDKLNYKVSLIEMADTAFEHDDLIQAAIGDDPDTLENYKDVKRQIQDAKKQLIGPNYSRVVFDIGAAEEGSETFALIDRLQKTVKEKYPDAIFAGDAMVNHDIASSFNLDNLKVTIFTIVFVYLILVFTFKNWGIPIPLVLVIQSAIFINFALFPLLFHTNCYFFVSLIVSAIQMGATIDYCIVISNRYLELKKTEKSKKQAIIDSINQSFPTILTSGTILVSASLFIGIIVKDPLVSSLGYCLCRGCAISILSAMIVVPGFLLLLDKFFDKSDLSPALNKLGENLKKKKKKAKESLPSLDASALQLPIKVVKENNENKEDK